MTIVIVILGKSGRDEDEDKNEKDKWDLRLDPRYNALPLIVLVVTLMPVTTRYAVLHSSIIVVVETWAGASLIILNSYRIIDRVDNTDYDDEDNDDGNGDGDGDAKASEWKQMNLLIIERQKYHLINSIDYCACHRNNDLNQQLFIVHLLWSCCWCYFGCHCCSSSFGRTYEDNNWKLTNRRSMPASPRSSSCKRIQCASSPSSWLSPSKLLSSDNWWYNNC